MSEYMLFIITQIVTVEHGTFATTQNLPVVYYVVFPENAKCQNARNFAQKTQRCTTGSVVAHIASNYS